MNTDWIEWNGGECPVNPETVVEYKLRGGCAADSQAENLEWNHTGDGSDIIAYSVASNIPPIVPSSTTTTSPQKTESPLETQVSQGPLIDLDHAISTAIQIALRRGVSVDSITAMLTEINIEFKNARPYIQAALKPHENTGAAKT